jgi:hypothetical protein
VSKRFWANFLVAVLLSACASNVGDLSAWSYRPPSGWATTPDLPIEIPNAKSWHDDAGLVTFAPLNVGMYNAYKSGGPDAAVTLVPLCRGILGYQIRLRPASGDFSDLVVVRWHKEAILGSYLFHRTQAPSPTAEASIHSICPRSTSKRQ